MQELAQEFPFSELARAELILLGIVRLYQPFPQWPQNVKMAAIVWGLLYKLKVKKSVAIIYLEKY